MAKNINFIVVALTVDDFVEIPELVKEKKGAIDEHGVYGASPDDWRPFLDCGGIEDLFKEVESYLEDFEDAKVNFISMSYRIQQNLHNLVELPIFNIINDIKIFVFDILSTSNEVLRNFCSRVELRISDGDYYCLFPTCFFFKRNEFDELFDHNFKDLKSSIIHGSSVERRIFDGDDFKQKLIQCVARIILTEPFEGNRLIRRVPQML